jgi:putative hydrolase of the HAD superfamily
MVIFFDIDDTLLDHRKAMRAATIALHTRLGLPISTQDFLSRWYAAHSRYYPRYLNGEMSVTAARRARIRETIDCALSDLEADDLFASYLASYEASWNLFSDVMPCLNRLSSFRIGVISNGHSEEQRRKLACFGLTDRFEHVLISDECGFPKPRPEIFAAACSAVHLAPSEAVYVGDQYAIDATAARNAGLRGIWLDREGTATSEHLPPIIQSLDYLIPESLEELR